MRLILANRVRRFLRRAGGWMHPARADEAMDAEMRHHLEMEALELQQQGMSADAARRHAAIAFGGIERFKQEAREARPAHHVENIVRDARHALRQLRHSRGLALSAATLLAVGIGGTVALFNVLNAIYLKPLPYPNADGLALVQIAMSDATCAARCTRVPDADEREAFATATVSIARTGTIAVTAGTAYLPGGATVLEGAAVNAATVEMLGMKAAIGRTLTAPDYRSNAPAVMMLTHSGWQSEFNGDSAIIGKPVTLGNTQYEVVGVLAASSELGAPLFSFNKNRAQYLVPESADAPSSVTTVIVELGARSTAATVRAEFDLLLAQRKSSGMSSAPPSHALVQPLREAFSARYKSSFWTLFGAVAAVLLITCLNVTGLFLARLNERSTELATRTALGASRYRLVQQIAAETAVIAATGGFGGVVVATLGTISMRWLPTDKLPFWTPVAIDANAIAFAVALTVVAGLILGIAPLFVLSPQRLLSGLRNAASAGRSRSKLRSTLVTLQVALSVTLLGAAGLLTKVLADAELRDIGTAKHGWSYVFLRTPAYVSDDATTSLNERLIAALHSVPGVTDVGVLGRPQRVRRAPASADAARAMRGARERAPAMTIESGLVELPATVAPGSAEHVSPEYFRSIDQRIVMGRDFTSADRAGSEPVAIVDEPTAHHLFGDANPLGRRVKFGGASSDNAWMTIIGVASGVVGDALDRNVRYAPQLFRPLLQVPAQPSSLTVRFGAGRSVRQDMLRRAIREADPRLPVEETLTVEESIARRMWPARFNAYVLSGFALFAVGLCCLGIYAAVAFVVAARQREIAIRMALGARKAEVVLLLMRSSARMVTIGLVVGLAGTMAASKTMQSMLYGTSAFNPWVFGTVALLMIAISMAAAWIPAGRAANNDPSKSLRLQ